MVSKSFLKKEISVVHSLILGTSKFLIGLALGIMWIDFGLPYTYAIMIAGVLFLSIGVMFLFREELLLEHWLVQRLQSRTSRKKRK